MPSVYLMLQQLTMSIFREDVFSQMGTNTQIQIQIQIQIHIQMQIQIQIWMKI